MMNLLKQCFMQKELMIAIKSENGRKTLSGNTYKEFVGNKVSRVEENMTEEPNY